MLGDLHVLKKSQNVKMSFELGFYAEYAHHGHRPVHRLALFKIQCSTSRSDSEGSVKLQSSNDWYAHGASQRSRQQFHDRVHRSGKSADDGPVETNVLEVLSDLRLNLPH